jgi:predicted O-methyltransferase YrrM
MSLRSLFSRHAAGPPSAESGPAEWVARARADEAFQRHARRFAETKVAHWLGDEEMALHFGVAAYAPGAGTVVELGSFEGGSAAFLAAGLRARGGGRLVAIDPHLGGPPWLGLGPQQRTLSKFRHNMRALDLERWVEVWPGDSSSVAAVWPGEPIDAVFIDGDHSFLGALKDFECWAPKVRAGGLVLFDDADDAALPELLGLIEHVKTLSSVTYLATVQGIAVFRRGDAPPAELFADMARANRRRGLVRPWDLSRLHETPLPARFGRTPVGGEQGAEAEYLLCFLARCGAGAYGYTAASAPADRTILGAVAADRGDGPLGEVRGGEGRRYRAITCAADEAAALAPNLLPGGVMTCRDPSAPATDATALGTRRKLIAAGLEGCGWGGAIHWGVWQAGHLSSDAIIAYAMSPVG